MLKKMLKNSFLYPVLSLTYQKFLSIGDKGYVLMLHRVAEHNSSGIVENENMKISPAFLDSFIAKCKKKYEIIASDKICEYIKSGNKKKFLVFTFDDGYKDNFSTALPVFEKYDAPFTIFVASDFPNKKAVMWWYGLEELLQQTEKIVLSNGKEYSCKSFDEKNKAFCELRSEILKIEQTQLFGELQKIFSAYQINWHKYCDELCMTWSDVAELVKNPLVTIGAHTAHHYNLHALPSEKDVHSEISEGITEFKKKIGDKEIIEKLTKQINQNEEKKEKLSMKSVVENAISEGTTAEQVENADNVEELARKTEEVELEGETKND